MSYEKNWNVLYQKIIIDLKNVLPLESQIILPCCGQGRLAFELALQNYKVVG